MDSSIVSVIIPNYNHEKYLKERIESVLNQTYDNFEVIILDDKSLDSSRSIIELYKNHPKVSHIVFNNVNSGSTFLQWQKGFDLAIGKYIWIAESDDVAEPQFLEKILNGMNKDDNIVLGFSELDYIDENGRKMEWYPPKHEIERNPEEGHDFIARNMVFGNSIYNASGVVFKKQALDKISLEYTQYKAAGDYLFWIEILLQGRVYKINQVLNHFRQHRTKVTSGSVARGVNFTECNRIYHKLKRIGLIRGIKRDIVVGYWLRRLSQYKDSFIDKTIYENCIKMWREESVFGNFSKIFYLGYCLGHV